MERGRDHAYAHRQQFLDLSRHGVGALCCPFTAVKAPSHAPSHPILEEQDQHKGHDRHRPHKDEGVDDAAAQLLPRAVTFLRVRAGQGQGGASV